MAYWIPGAQKFPTFINISPAIPVALAAPMVTDSAERRRWSNRPMLRRDQSLVTAWVFVRGQRANNLRGVAPGLAPKQLNQSIQLAEV